MPARRIEFTVPQEMWDRIEAARGDIPRAAFIKRALTTFMGVEQDRQTLTTWVETGRIEDKP